jgi:hypothetical protein
MFKNINDSLYEIFVNIFQEKNKNSIIEPLICLIRLAILEFKPCGTKISIYNNRIIYNEPNLLQGAVRWSNGDSRDDLHNIYHPISKASEWYDINDTNIKNIFIYSIRGLEKLKLSYNRNSTINHSIQYYIDYLTKSLNQENNRNFGENGGSIKTRTKSQTRNNTTNETEENISTDEHNMNTIFNKLKDIWNNREISIITNLLDELENRRNNDTYTESDIETIITTIETLILSKEQKVYDLIVKTTTLLE